MVWRGVVTRVSDDGVWVQVPRLGGVIEFGPCPGVGGAGAYRPDVPVLVAALEGRRDDLVVLGALAAAPA